MTAAEDALKTNYAAAVLAFIEEDRLVRDQKLNELNRMAGGQLEKSEELVLYRSSRENAATRLIAPELQTLTDRLIELRQAAGMDQPQTTEPPAPPIHGARTLLMNEDGTGRIDPVRTQVMPGAETDDYTEENPPSDVSH